MKFFDPVLVLLAGLTYLWLISESGGLKKQLNARKKPWNWQITNQIINSQCRIFGINWD